MNAEDLLIGEGDGVVSTVVRTFLGVEREAFVCPECDVACQETHTYNRHTAAFDGGACPAWACPECGSTYVREVSDESHAMDLYGRDPPQ